METARRFIADSPTRFGAYTALQCALMERFVARGGTPEDFCLRLAPVFRRRYATILVDPDPLPARGDRSPGREAWRWTAGVGGR